VAADDFVAIAKFGRTKREWLARFLDLESGFPSHDCFNAIVAAIKPAKFGKCLLSWITALHEITDGQVVAIDGKTLRRSFDAANSKAAIHMMSPWATANHINLGQVVVDAKSNEITAIPKLLEMLELSGAMVTIDAMGCQTEIARQIVGAGADYCLAVKDNQPTLHQGIIDFFEKHVEDDFAGIRMRCHVTDEKGHGREEARYYMICPVPKDLPDRSRWTGLKAIGVVISDAQRDGKRVGENRYYIVSKFVAADRWAGGGGRQEVLAVGPPLGDQAGVLLVALEGAVAAQVIVLAVDRDDSEVAGLVQAIPRRAVGLRHGCGIRGGLKR
jgi:predicted transposase YbfD/YdcC